MVIATGVSETRAIKQGDLVIINIPASFRVDDKPLIWYFRRNKIDFLHERNGEFDTFRFLSTHTADHAAVIWECLTGGKLLGYLPTHKDWKEYCFRS